MDATLGKPGKHPATGAPIEFTCTDGQVLCGHLFEPAPGPDAGDYAGTAIGTVVIACATGVRARYYHRYAAFLAEHGFTALTFDYRGIGASAPADLRGFRARWHEWGTQDIDAVLRWARNHLPDGPVHFVGHSFGGFGVGLAPESRHLGRILTIGAQHAYWRDYAKGHRARFLARWHLLMPVSTRLSGYFQGKRRGWLEDLPRGVALDWARSRRDFTRNLPYAERGALRAVQHRLRTPILALAPADDPYASTRAMARALAYTPNAPSAIHRLDPEAYGRVEMGHFGLFHSEYTQTFWRQSLDWLRDGVDPWATEPGRQAEGDNAPEQPPAQGAANQDRPSRRV